MEGERGTELVERVSVHGWMGHEKWVWGEKPPIRR